MKAKFLLSSIILITSCQSTVNYPSTPDAQFDYHFAKSKESVEKLDCNKAFLELMKAINKNQTDIRINQFKGHKENLICINKGALETVQELNFEDSALEKIGNIQTALDFAIIDELTHRNAMLELVKTINIENKEHQIPLHLGSSGRLLQLLTKENLAIVFDRTLKLLDITKDKENSVAFLSKQFSAEPNNKELINLVPLVAAIQSGLLNPPIVEASIYAGSQNKNENKIVELLDHYSIPAAKLNSLKEYFPQYVKQRLDIANSPLHLSVISEDKLLKYDLEAFIKNQIPNINWIEDSIDSATIEIEVLKHQISEDSHSETVVIPRHEVEFISGALLMPNNSSFLYDKQVRTQVLDYAYHVKLRDSDFLVRDKQHNIIHKCSNSRVENIFGGVQSADWIANDNMKSDCEIKNGLNLNKLSFSALVDQLLKHRLIIITQS